MMSLLPRADLNETTNKIDEGVDIMDIGNIKMVKDTLVDTKKTTNKDKNTNTKQGCIKMNDYFSF